MLLDEDRQVQMSWSAHRAAGSRMSATLAWNLEISLGKRAASSGAITNTPLQRKVKHRNGSTLRLRTHY